MIAPLASLGFGIALTVAVFAPGYMSPDSVAQLVEAGVPRPSITVHPACTKCGGDKFASYRRDGTKAGRMIALIART